MEMHAGIERLPTHGLKYIGGSGVDSTRRAGGWIRRSWDKFKLMHCDRFLTPPDSEEHKMWVMIEFVSWCCKAEGNGYHLFGKFMVVQHFQRFEAGVEVSTTTLVRFITHSQALLEVTLRQGLRARRVFWGALGMLLEGEDLIPSLTRRGQENDVVLFQPDAFLDHPVGLCQTQRWCTMHFV